MDEACALLDDRVGAVNIFNDRPETTHADVLALLDKVIAEERAKHE